jgi:hypothetical protein
VLSDGGDVEEEVCNAVDARKVQRVVKYKCPANSLTSAFTATETQTYTQVSGFVYLFINGAVYLSDSNSLSGDLSLPNFESGPGADLNSPHKIMNRLQSPNAFIMATR